MKVFVIIFLVNFTIFADAGKGGSKFCKSADMKLDELKDMMEEKDCPSPVVPPAPLMSCKEIYDATGSKENKAYTVDLNGCKKLPVYCNMDGAGLGDCGGGGWTLVMKINGAKQTFKFDSPFWTNKKEYGLPEGERLAWMTKRLSYQPTGTHPSPRSVSV
ncbi:uncharacterized skeletal organic matrix protein 5-like [Stylophora pistillata]|uniref:uncharacterized skeletal organic matrix protein 5-like n=1 Tax=Stylophora pistillata TaxID=50429 RepID=UPI000C0534C5|nr:uncharacterized skeletal organic matrix protein 5-like [Stylophora pistillata]